jgi:hypothetical protein
MYSVSFIRAFNSGDGIKKVKKQKSNFIKYIWNKVTKTLRFTKYNVLNFFALCNFET